mmetsp:Transcript_28349/g.32448  ORF Transcript_28349/g.32448 Transcript_28349/m.32448 type:complete len:91 (+) Transcript_28349:114-386(+)
MSRNKKETKAYCDRRRNQNRRIRISNPAIVPQKDIKPYHRVQNKHSQHKPSRKSNIRKEIPNNESEPKALARAKPEEWQVHSDPAGGKFC